MAESAKVDRRSWLKVAGGTCAGLIVGGLAGYYGKGEGPERLVTQNVTETVRETIGAGATITQTVGGGTSFPPLDVPPMRWVDPWMPSQYFVDTKKYQKMAPWVIGVTVPFMGNAWQAVAQLEALQWAKYNPKIGKILWIHHNNDASDQIAGVRDYISQGVDGIILDPASPSALAGVCKEVLDAGIPLVTTSAPIDTTDYTSTVIPGLEERGYTLAKGLFEDMGGSGKIIRIWGMKGNSWETMNQNGIDRAMKEYPGITEVATAVGLWDYTETKKAMSDLIPTLPKDVRGIIADDGSETLGAVDCLIEAGWDVSKISLGGDPLNGSLLIAKDRGLRFTASGSAIYNDRKALETMVQILEGLPVMKNNLLQCRTWTSEEALKLADPDMPQLTNMDCTLWQYEEGRKALKDTFASLGFK